jgi:hypothetical protein
MKPFFNLLIHIYNELHSDPSLPFPDKNTTFPSTDTTLATCLSPVVQILFVHE